MRGGFRRLVHPATSLSAVDLASTRACRQQLHEQIRLRQHLLTLLRLPLDEESLRVTPYELVDEETAERHLGVG